MMDQYFAELYNTPGLAEEKEKAAQAEVFVKLAVDNKIDISRLSDGQIAELWNATFDEGQPKTASATPDVVKQAQQEFAAISQVTDMQKQADAFGRQAAHSFYAELDEIQKSAAGAGIITGEKMRDIIEPKAYPDTGPIPMRNVPNQPAPKGAKSPTLAGPRRGLPDTNLEDALDKTRAAEERLKKMHSLKGTTEYAKEKGRQGYAATRAGAEKGYEALKGVAKNKWVQRGAMGLGSTALFGGAAYGAHRAMKKEESALDTLASELAFNKAAEAGWDSDEAAERIIAVVTLSGGESQKVAMANDLDQAVEIRSLELLEQAGYPVTWEN
jgi:hypothetical protein